MIIRERVIAESAGSQLCPACSKLIPYIASHEEWHRNRCGLQSVENLSRIHIIGGPGSGKTTLARQVGEFLGLKPHELDQIAFTGRDYAERPFPERVADIAQIADEPAWITEGLFVLWTDRLLERANMIVWLDNVTWQKGILRIARRFVSSAVQEAQKRQGLERFARFQDYFRHLKQFVQVVFTSRAYYRANTPEPRKTIESRVNTAAFLKAYNDKVIHCNNDEAVEAFMDYIRFCYENGK